LTALTGEGRQIMYVDDEPMIVSLVTRLLSKAGFEVTGFTRPSLAVEAFTANPQFFDVIITDFNMPELSGLELAQSALARRPDVPIVVTSGYISTELQREMERLGLVHLLYKPDLAKRLLPTIRALALGPIPDRS
jgi:CheY-like chemotaxis protein